MQSSDYQYCEHGERLLANCEQCEQALSAPPKDVCRVCDRPLDEEELREAAGEPQQPKDHIGDVNELVPKDAKRPEMWDEFKLTNKVKRMEFRDHIRELQAYIAALPRSEPKEAGDEYEGDTAKGWYEAWNRENDAWQKMVQHHEELEEAVKVMLKDGMKPTEYLEAMEKVRRILAIEGSAPAKSAPEAEGVRALVKAIKEAAWYRGTEGGMDRDWEENAEGVEPIALDATEIWPAYQAVKAALGDL